MYDVRPLWNFQDPAASEARFRQEQGQVDSEKSLILETQIARTYGLRGDWNRAREILREVKNHLNADSPEVNVRHDLELGRTYASPAHKPEQLTKEAKGIARALYMNAFEIAKSNGLHFLAVDALHMMTMVDQDPDDQIRWNKMALEYMEASKDVDALSWEGSLRNNLGYAYSLQDLHDDAIKEYEKSRTLAASAGKIFAERIARWMIAKSLRLKGNLNEALAMQLQLEQEFEDDNKSDPYVFHELIELYEALGKPEKVEEYRAKSENN